jgi:hypothetical protein
MLAQGGAPYEEVLSALLAGEDLPPSQADSFPDLPAVISGLGEEAREALRVVPGFFGKVNLSSRRALTEDERITLGHEDIALRALLSALKRRSEAIAEIVRVHADVTAEEAAPAASIALPRDPRGHYLHATAKGRSRRIPIPGADRDWSLEFHGGGVTYDMPDLLRMLADKEITRAEFSALTRPVLDEGKAAAFMTSKPARALQILARITRVGAPSNYLYVRKPQARQR